MTITSIFVAGIVCFALILVGLVLTIYEFRNIARQSDVRQMPTRPVPLKVEPIRVRARR